MKETLLSSLKYLIIILKICGLWSFSIEEQNEKYISRTSKFEIYWKGILIFLTNMLIIALFQFRITRVDEIAGNKNYILILILYSSYCLSYDISIILNYINRKKIFGILVKFNRIERDLQSMHIQVDYSKVKIFYMKVILVQSINTVLYVIFKWFSVLAVWPVLNILIHSLLEMEYITFFFIFCLYISKLNINFESLLTKYEVPNITILINKYVTMYKELHELCVLINRTFSLIVLKICTAFSVAVCDVFWIVRLYRNQKNVNWLRLLVITIWIYSVFLGLVLILSICERIVSEVCLKKYNTVRLEKY